MWFIPVAFSLLAAMSLAFYTSSIFAGAALYFTLAALDSMFSEYNKRWEHNDNRK